MKYLTIILLLVGYQTAFSQTPKKPLYDTSRGLVVYVEDLGLRKPHDVFDSFQVKVDYGMIINKATMTEFEYQLRNHTDPDASLVKTGESWEDEPHFELFKIKLLTGKIIQEPMMIKFIDSNKPKK
jgi:hypothetical protein